MHTRMTNGLCLAVAVLLLSIVYAQSWAAGAEGDRIFVITALPVKDEILVGEPLFVKVTLQNKSDLPQRLRNLSVYEGISQLPWRLEIAKPDENLREIDLFRLDAFPVHRDEKTLVSLAPGQKLTDYLTIWFAAHGDVPEERSLVFRRGGQFRFRIVFGIQREGDPLDQPARRIAAEGKVRLSGRPKGFTEMVRGLRAIMLDDSKVAYQHAKKLHLLLGVLKDSPYARFVKWQIVRSYPTDGQDERGNDVLEGPGGREEAGRLMALADDLLGGGGQEESPLVRDALTMKGIALLVVGQKAKAQEICEELERRYRRSAGIRKLRAWAY
ncbi:MAG: hypothetical protein AMS16_00145 [Planctomycetes bacterium DG_58]|nr:MAG: hypothetical protein AMS16_00145 [Planctomycetes bacterium DG_58]